MILTYHDQLVTWALIQSKRVLASVTDNVDKHDSNGIELSNCVTVPNLQTAFSKH